MTKGELMSKVYTENERRQIDSAIPSCLWKQVDNTYYFVMNYNNNGAFGELEDMRVIAEKRKIKI